MKKLISFIRSVYLNKATIYEALISYITSSEETKKLAKERLLECRKCIYYSKNTEMRPFGYLPFPHCISCGCFIGLKKYSKTNTCPNKIWKK